jgi:hypothetical protein
MWSQLTEAGCKAGRKAEARSCGLMARSLRGLNLLLQDYTADVSSNASQLSLSRLAAICATRVESLQVRGSTDVRSCLYECLRRHLRGVEVTVAQVRAVCNATITGHSFSACG